MEIVDLVFLSKELSTRPFEHPIDIEFTCFKGTSFCLTGNFVKGINE